MKSFNILALKILDGYDIEYLGVGEFLYVVTVVFILNVQSRNFAGWLVRSTIVAGINETPQIVRVIVVLLKRS